MSELLPSTRAFFLLPDGRDFLQVSMGGSPARYYQPVSHPALATIAHLNPAATHLEFARSNLYTTHPPHRTEITVFSGLRLYVFTRAVRQAGPGSWEQVPLYAPELVS